MSSTLVPGGVVHKLPVDLRKALIDPDALRSASDPHTELHSEEQKKMLYDALQELPEKERAAVVLRDIEGFSTAEVAEILGSSEGTVRSPAVRPE